ncbi:hypothetical protein VTO73DRAFT_15391 [Trametes versicolor]
MICQTCICSPSVSVQSCYVGSPDASTLLGYPGFISRLVSLAASVVDAMLYADRDINRAQLLVLLPVGLKESRQGLSEPIAYMCGRRRKQWA